jgi:hypothetical protein
MQTLDIEPSGCFCDSCGLRIGSRGVLEVFCDFSILCEGKDMTISFRDRPEKTGEAKSYFSEEGFVGEFIHQRGARFG